jgi:hypothetical protein
MSTIERPRGDITRNDVKENIFLDLEVVKILCDAYPEALEDHKNSGRNTLLIVACGRDDNSLKIVKIPTLYLRGITVVGRIRLHDLM